MFYFDSFGLETPTLFLEEYVNLGSNERVQQYDESYCGAYCLYMIYLIDKGIKIKGALYNLINQVNCTEMYDECLCLGSEVKGDANQGTDGARCMLTCWEDKRQNPLVDANDYYEIIYHRRTYTYVETWRSPIRLYC